MRTRHTGDEIHDTARKRIWNHGSAPFHFFLEPYSPGSEKRTNDEMCDAARNQIWNFDSIVPPHFVHWSRQQRVRSTRVTKFTMLREIFFLIFSRAPPLFFCGLSKWRVEWNNAVPQNMIELQMWFTSWIKCSLLNFDSSTARWDSTTSFKSHIPER